MTEIDELCCMLDERDVKWSTSGVSTIRWRVGDTLFRFDEWAGKSRLFMIGVNPAQAVEVTFAEEVTNLHDQLASENAKLREMVKHLYACTTHSLCLCEECEYACVVCNFDYMLDELGIEDDE